MTKVGTVLATAVSTLATVFLRRRFCDAGVCGPERIDLVYKW